MVKDKMLITEKTHITEKTKKPQKTKQPLEIDAFAQFTDRDKVSKLLDQMKGTLDELDRVPRYIDLGIIGKNIREMREKRGMKQGRLARIVGSTPSRLSDIELGKRGLSIDFLAIIMMALDCRMVDLVKGSESPNAKRFDVIDGLFPGVEYRMENVYAPDEEKE